MLHRVNVVELIACKVLIGFSGSKFKSNLIHIAKNVNLPYFYVSPTSIIFDHANGCACMHSLVEIHNRGPH